MQRSLLILFFILSISEEAISEVVIPSAVLNKAIENSLASNAPALMLAKTYKPQNNIELKKYWVSEKFDGVRAYWNGEKFISRKGTVFYSPAWFTEVLPKIPLDGELWLGRHKFEKLSGIVRRLNPQDSDWKDVKFMVFDTPTLPVSFDDRLIQLKVTIENINAPHIRLVRQFKLHSQKTLMEKLDEVVELGAEGLMLHLGASMYNGRRTNDLLKVKKYEDAEAVVIEYLPGKGKYTGMLGAILVETAGKKRFKIGTGFSDKERSNPPAIGSVITYRYLGLTNKGLPRFASFMRERK